MWPKPGFRWAWLKNLLQDKELVVRAPVAGHIGKPVWVAKAITGGEYLFFASKKGPLQACATKSENLELFFVT